MTILTTFKKHHEIGMHSSIKNMSQKKIFNKKKNIKYMYVVNVYYTVIIQTIIEFKNVTFYACYYLLKHLFWDNFTGTEVVLHINPLATSRFQPPPPIHHLCCTKNGPTIVLAASLIAVSIVIKGDRISILLTIGQNNIFPCFGPASMHLCINFCCCSSVAP